MANRRGKGGRSDSFPLLGLQNHCGPWLQPRNQKTTASWQERDDKPRQCIEKQRPYSADKGPYRQDCGLPSGHVRLWELDCEEGRTLKNWCLRSVVLEKTLESRLDSKEIKPVNLQGDQPWILTGRTDAEAPLEIWCTQKTHGKVPDAGKDQGQKEKRESEDEMAGQHQCNEPELGQTLRDGEGQGGLVCCSPRGRKVRHDWATEQQGQRKTPRIHANNSTRSMCNQNNDNKKFKFLPHLKIWSNILLASFL